MSTERKFIQEVAMVVPTYQDFIKIADRLIDLGYTVEGVSDRSFPWKLFTTFGFNSKPGHAGIISVDFSDWEECKPVEIDLFDPELFMAIAAMSEGEELWPDEWVKRDGHIHDRNVKPGGMYKIAGVDGILVTVHDCGNSAYVHHIFRKATMTEIIDHFTKKEDQEGLDKTPTESRIVGKVFRKDRGKQLYDVLHLAYNANTLNRNGRVVVYKGRIDGNIYSMDLIEFDQKFNEVHEVRDHDLIAAYAKLNNLNKNQVVKL